jgi:hypothetical protein
VPLDLKIQGGNTMPKTVNELWRALLTPENQLAIAEILKGQLIDILKVGKESGLVDPTPVEIDNIKRAGTDLPEVCKLLCIQRYSKPNEDRRLAIDSIGYFLWREREFEKASGLSPAQLLLLRRRCSDLYSIARVIRDHRHYAAHENASVNDSGNALYLAGALLRLLEIVTVPEEQEAKAEKVREATRRVATIISGGDEGEPADAAPGMSVEEHLREIREMMAKQQNSVAEEDIENVKEDNEKIEENDGSDKRLKGTLGKNHLTPDFFVKGVEKKVEQLGQKQGVIYDLVERLLEAVSRMEARQHELTHSISNDLQSVLANQVTVLNDLNKKIEDTAQQVPALVKSAIGDFEEEMDTANFKDDLSQDELVQEQPDDVVSDKSFDSKQASAITVEQARQSLLALRNTIKLESLNQGLALENWENILQGPIITSMLKNQVTSLDEWKKIQDISWRYIKHKLIMDQQLDQEWGQISEILNSIDWPQGGYGELDDEMPF